MSFLTPHNKNIKVFLCSPVLQCTASCTAVFVLTSTCYVCINSVLHILWLLVKLCLFVRQAGSRIWWGTSNEKWTIYFRSSFARYSIYHAL